MTKQRKFAAIMSLISTVGNFGVIAIMISFANLKDFIAIIPNSPNIILILITGLLSLIIGTMLMTSVCDGKKTQLAALLVSVIVFMIAAFQMSITFVTVLFWPWSLYKLYQSEAT